MIRALAFITLLLAVVAAARPAHADDTFDARAAGALRVRRIENLVWALTAPCDKGDDTEQRQCRHVRDTRAAELAGATLLVDAGSDAFDVGAWSAPKKSVPVTLTECIRCAGVEVDGKTWYVVGAATPPRFEGGKLKTSLLHDNARQFPDEAAAKEWTRSLASARVQLLVKLPARPRWTVDGKSGISLEVLGYRVYSPCDGSVVLAKPAAGPGEIDKKLCRQVPAPAEPAAERPVVDVLTPGLIEEAMKPVKQATQACFEHFGVAGKAKLMLTIAADGTVEKYEQQGDFVATPTGQCVDQAVTKAAFPRTKKPRTTITFPIVLP